MNKITHLLVLAPIIAVSQVYGDVIVRSGEVLGSVESTQVEAAVGTTLTFRNSSDDADVEATPFYFESEWTLTWDDDNPEAVDFVGQLNFGDHFTQTDAGFMGGRSVQTFYGFAHNVKGTAIWDSGSRTLTYLMEPRERDDARASMVTETAPTSCEPEGRACTAFNKSSPGLEGLKLSFIFSDDLSSFSGTVTAVQFGGSGFTKSQTDIIMKLEGELE